MADCVKCTSPTHVNGVLNVADYPDGANASHQATSRLTPSMSSFPLVPNPDKKNRFMNSRGVLKAAIYFGSGSQPWKLLLGSVVWAAVAVEISTLASRAFSAEKRSACRYICSPISFDTSAAAYNGLALFLLLGFRVNEAYGRYQRGLAEWDEGVGTALPSLALQIGRLFEPGTWHPGDRARLFGLLAAFPVALKRSLRREAVAPELSRLLGPADAGRVVSGGPACVLDVVNAYVLSAAREHGPVGQCLAGRLLALTGRLALAANRCESIASYAVTYGYLAHLRLFMGCWILLLPFALVQECGWFTVAIVPVVAYGILGMEAIAEELTEPFGYDLNDIPIGLISNQLVERVRVIYEMSCLPVDGIVRRCDPPFAENGSPEVGNNSKRMNNGMNCGCECTSVEEG